MIPNIQLPTQDQAYQRYLDHNWKLERMNKLHNFKSKLNAIVVMNNSKSNMGKWW